MLFHPLLAPMGSLRMNLSFFGFVLEQRSIGLWATESLHVKSSPQTVPCGRKKQTNNQTKKNFKLITFKK